ncbi:hypothetical protein [Deinococcus misasensis]|uniref:hypothetical protein n=1 Tax=Deinococcus misasensis TaxID=392413 RepID=UPI000553E3BD|nr:hypothetical protein [Deinococcus misasensis]
MDLLNLYVMLPDQMAHSLSSGNLEWKTVRVADQDQTLVPFREVHDIHISYGLDAILVLLGGGIIGSAQYEQIFASEDAFFGGDYTHFCEDPETLKNLKLQINQVIQTTNTNLFSLGSLLKVLMEGQELDATQVTPKFIRQAEGHLSLFVVENMVGFVPLTVVLRSGGEVVVGALVHGTLTPEEAHVICDLIDEGTRI